MRRQMGREGAGAGCPVHQDDTANEFPGSPTRTLPYPGLGSSMLPSSVYPVQPIAETHAKAQSRKVWCRCAAQKAQLIDCLSGCMVSSIRTVAVHFTYILLQILP